MMPLFCYYALGGIKAVNVRGDSLFNRKVKGIQKPYNHLLISIQRGTSMTTIQWLALFITLLTIPVQLYIAIRRLRADHERQKKQSTIEDFGDTYLLCRYEIEAKYGLEPITAATAEQIDSDLEKCAVFNKLLGTLEHMAVGVNTGVYDRDVVYRMSSGSMIGLRHRLHHYIEHRRKMLNQPKLFVEHERLASDFEKVYRPIPRGGEIEYS
jgi:hypothetical protein